MRIAYLAKREALHTVRWVNALTERGHEVHLLSLAADGEPLHPDVRLHVLPVHGPGGFFLNALAVRRLLGSIRPEVLNTHYATGYGTLSRLAAFRPTVLSVWGSDVYEFPGKSIVHRTLLRGNLGAADLVSSTSHAMARQTLSIRPDLTVRVVPFGIDVERFRPAGPRAPRADGTIVVGTVKTLGRKYGIDTLIRAFAALRTKLERDAPRVAADLRLSIAGGGPDRAALERLSTELGVADVTTFVGAIPHADVPSRLRELDVYVALSRLESFGVAVLEASACELPVVVSDVGGLPEVVVDGRTGHVVPVDDVEASAAALEGLVLDRARRERMGAEGRLHVIERYEWTSSVEAMERVYAEAVARGG